MAINFIFGNISLTEQQIANLDYNDDGVVNVLDVVGCVNEILMRDATPVNDNDIVYIHDSLTKVPKSRNHVTYLCDLYEVFEGKRYLGDKEKIARFNVPVKYKDSKPIVKKRQHQQEYFDRLLRKKDKTRKAMKKLRKI